MVLPLQSVLGQTQTYKCSGTRTVIEHMWVNTTFMSVVNLSHSFLLFQLFQLVTTLPTVAKTVLSIFSIIVLQKEEQFCSCTWTLGDSSWLGPKVTLNCPWTARTINPEGLFNHRKQELTYTFRKVPNQILAGVLVRLLWRALRELNTE